MFNNLKLFLVKSCTVTVIFTFNQKTRVTQPSKVILHVNALRLKIVI